MLRALQIIFVAIGACAFVLGIMVSPLHAQGGGGLPGLPCSNCWGGCNNGTVSGDQSCEVNYSCTGLTNPCYSECDCEEVDPALRKCGCVHHPIP